RLRQDRRARADLRLPRPVDGRERRAPAALRRRGEADRLEATLPIQMGRCQRRTLTEGSEAPPILLPFDPSVADDRATSPSEWGGFASRLRGPEGSLLTELARVSVQFRQLLRRVDAEPEARQTLGHEGGDIGLGEPAMQQIRSRGIDHRL